MRSKPHGKVTDRTIARLQIPYLLRHHNASHVRATFVFANGLLTIAILSTLAYFTRCAFVFPSLGPTAILLFTSPRSRAAKPRSVMIGHAIGIVCGYLALVVTGLANTPLMVDSAITWPRIIAASLALAATGAGMVLAKAPHAPAGATTLIIALGLITAPSSLVIIEVAVGLLVLQALAIDRLADIKHARLYT